MNGYLSDRVQVTLIYLPFQSPANRSLRVPTVSLKRPTKTKQAPNADGFPSWEESVGFCEERRKEPEVNLPFTIWGNLARIHRFSMVPRDAERMGSGD